MAAAFLWVLVAVGVTQATVPKPCQGDPASWCQDMATAIQCHRVQQCHHFGDNLALDMTEGDLVTEGDTVVAPRRWQCTLCIKVLKKVKAMVGKDPDEAAVVAALAKGCRVLGERWGRRCRRLLQRREEKIREVLRDGDPPRAACTAIGCCGA